MNLYKQIKFREQIKLMKNLPLGGSGDWTTASDPALS